MDLPLETHRLHHELTGRLAWLRSLAGHLVRDSAAAEDLVQDTVVAALHRPPQLDRPLEPWLAGVLRKLHLQRQRGSRRRARREAVRARPEALPDTAEVAARLEMVQALVGAIQELPEPYRTAVTLRYESGLEPIEIARRQGLNGSTVRGRIREGLSRLRARLDAQAGSRAGWVGLLAPLSRGPWALAVPASEPSRVVAGGSGWGPAGASLPRWAWIVGAAGMAAIVWSVAVLGPTFGARPANDRAVDRYQSVLGSSAEPSPGMDASADPNPRPGRRVAVNPLDFVAAPVRDERSSPAGPKAGAEVQIYGQVVDARGLPASGRRVAVVSAIPYPLAEASPGVGERPLLAEVTTSADGRFVLVGLESGLVQLGAFGDGGLPTWCRPLRLVSGERRRGIVLSLADSSDSVASSSDPSAIGRPRAEAAAKAAGGRRVTPVFRPVELRVRWMDDGSPAAGLRVRVRRRFEASRIAMRAGFRVDWRPVSSSPAASVDSDGRVRLALPETEASSRAEFGVEFLDEIGSLGIQPLPDATRGAADTWVARRASVQGVVVRDALEAWQPTAIGISCGDGEIQTASLDEAGRFFFANLPAGSYGLRWLGAPTVQSSTMVFHMGPVADAGLSTFELASGSKRTLRLDRNQLPLVTGSVRVDSDLPASWQVDLSRPRIHDLDSPRIALPLDAAGRLRSRVGHPGRYRVRVSTTDGRRRAPHYRTELAVSAADGDGARFVVALTTCTVHGRREGSEVTGPEPSWWLRTAQPSGGWWLAPVDFSVDGSFRIARAAPGEGEIVRADADGTGALAAAVLARVSIPPNGRSDLVLR